MKLNKNLQTLSRELVEINLFLFLFNVYVFSANWFIQGKHADQSHAPTIIHSFLFSGFLLFVQKLLIIKKLR